MFHLFAGIQLVPDIASFGFGKEFIISKFDDYTLADGAVSIKEYIPSRQQTFGTVYAESYDQLPYQTDLDFFADVYANDNSVVEVYADRLNYAIILCKFIKMLFPKKDKDIAYLEYKLSLDKFYVDYVYNRNVTIQQVCYPVDKMREEFTILTKEQFGQIFDQTVVTGDVDAIADFRRLVKNELSTEYHIASMLSGDIQFNQLLDKRIKNTILKVLGSSVQEVNPFVTYNIFTGLYHFNNTVDCDIKQSINSTPIADLLNRVDIFEPITTDDYSKYNAEYERLAAFLTNCNDFGWDKVDMDYARKCIKYLDPSFHIKDVIVDLLTEHDVKIFLFSEIKNINPLLLFHIFDLYATRNSQYRCFVVD